MRKIYRWYNQKHGIYSSRIIQINSQRGQISNWEHRYLTETLISEIWQSWCLFSRATFFASIRGAKFRDGSFVPRRDGDNSWRRLGYEASAYKKMMTPKENKHQSFKMLNEPTWGDLDAFIRIISGANPPNKSALLAAYGGSFQGVKDLQKIRNCCAHKNIENYLDIRSLAISYVISPNATPTDIAWSIKKGSSLLAIESWLHETRLIADMATASC